MSKLSQKWFFFLDRLHIQSAERYFMSALMTLFALLWLVQPLFEKGSKYDDAYYEPLMTVFHDYSSKRYEERRELLAQYYPDNEEQIDRFSRAVLPVGFEERILEHVAVRRAETAGLLREAETDSASASYMQPEREHPAERVSQSGEKVNINVADVTTLMKLPGIGRAIAERIVTYRINNGPFQKPEDIMKVNGIGPAKYERLKHLLEV